MAIATYNVTWQCSQPLSTRRAPITQFTVDAPLTDLEITALVTALNALSYAQVGGITQQVYSNKVLPSALPDPANGENTSFSFRGYAAGGQRVSTSIWIPAKKEDKEETDLLAIFGPSGTYPICAKDGSAVEYAGQREGRKLT